MRPSWLSSGEQVCVSGRGRRLSFRGARGFLLDAAANPVQAQVGYSDDVERVGDLNGLG